jgi:HipA-like protein
MTKSLRGTFILGRPMRLALESSFSAISRRCQANKVCGVTNVAYLAASEARPISLTLPLRPEPYLALDLFPFFYGLLSEGSAKDLQCRALKIDPDDAFNRLIKTLHSDTIGSVTVREIVEDEEVQDA